MSAPHDVPTIEELVEAVRQFLSASILPVVDGQLRYHTRVAVNVLEIVERELLLGPEQHRQHLAGLASLGVADEAELAVAIRNGSLEDRLSEVVTFVRATVRAKLDVANPDYD
jgi:hypothetical protein